jgi:L-iditol 2-dehydrogenase
MKAYVLHGIDDLRFEDVEKPNVGEDEVLVEVKAAGICGSDIPRIYKTGAHRHPLIPGHEFSGEVREVGDSSNNKWLNKRVGIFPLIPCRECEPCQKGSYELCRNYNYLGSRTDGGFSEFCIVPVKNLIELPDNVSYKEGAMLEPMAVAVHAIRRTNVKKDNNVVICGLGTIGTFILMFLKEMGLENICVVGNKDIQKETALKLGVSQENYCDAKKNDINKWFNDKNIDVIFECVGKNDTINFAIDNVSPNGNVVFVGNPATDILFEKATYWKILRNQIAVTGTWNSSFNNTENDDWHYVLDKLSKKAINPESFITHTFELEKLTKGLEIMRDKSEEYIKIMVTR